MHSMAEDPAVCFQGQVVGMVNYDLLEQHSG
jgi:hypothetical protein